ncbi:hypothetical protein B0H14DRAFT_2781603 [Mycena olivaceomarginata]|nr:hypothetical protein B0H14DRAFT_2781603 [Mycena olivaceomarginata]
MRPQCQRYGPQVRGEAPQVLGEAFTSSRQRFSRPASRCCHCWAAIMRGESTGVWSRGCIECGRAAGERRDSGVGAYEPWAYALCRRGAWRRSPARVASGSLHLLCVAQAYRGRLGKTRSTTVLRCAWRHHAARGRGAAVQFARGNACDA